MTKTEFNKRYPRFIYESYSVKNNGNKLLISFVFKIEPNIVFKPKIIFSSLGSHFKTLNKEAINNIAFHLGLAEIPSYWKSTCSPEIIIEAGKLNKNQIRFWKKLLINGLGEFFYINKVDFIKKDFVKISNKPNDTFSHIIYLKNQFNKVTSAPIAFNLSAIFS